MIVTDERVAAFVSKELGFSLCPPWTAVGIERNGSIIGGVVFNMYEGADVHASAAGRGFGKDFLVKMGCYVFEQLNCSRITVKTEKEYVAKLAEKMGGKREGILRNHFGEGRDAVIVGILKSEYRFR